MHTTPTPRIPHTPTLIIQNGFWTTINGAKITLHAALDFGLNLTATPDLALAIKTHLTSSGLDSSTADERLEQVRWSDNLDAAKISIINKQPENSILKVISRLTKAAVIEPEIRDLAAMIGDYLDQKNHTNRIHDAASTQYLKASATSIETTVPISFSDNNLAIAPTYLHNGAQIQSEEIEEIRQATLAIPKNIPLTLAHTRFLHDFAKATPANQASATSGTKNRFATASSETRFVLNNLQQHPSKIDAKLFEDLRKLSAPVTTAIPSASELIKLFNGKPA